MNISRRGFLSGATAIGFGGWRRLFAVPSGWKPPRAPNLVFGVISDTHLRTEAGSSGKPGRNWSDKYFATALEHFKRRNVDAVVHCGDMAHRGQVEEMQFHANVWRTGFGTGGPVKLFVTGNHDKDGADYGSFVSENYPDPEERAKHVLNTDMAANWERIWGEPYPNVWHKEVRGYHFFGRNWGVDYKELANIVNDSAAPCGLDDGVKPFFVLQHCRPEAALRKSVRTHRNALAFFGHNHWSVANWNMIYRYGDSLTVIQCASCEPRGCGTLVEDGYICKAKLEGRDAVGKGRQGFVVRVYDDMLVIERREFTNGVSCLGEDWMMPLGKSGAHPFSKDELKKAIGKPQFREGALLSIRQSPERPGTQATSTESKDLIRMSIPLADGNPEARVYAYEIVVVGDAGAAKLRKAVYAAGVNMGIGHEPNGGVTTVEIPKTELPPGKTLIVAVRPLSSLGSFGKPIVAEWKS